MAFKPYCAACATWHTEQEGHQVRPENTPEFIEQARVFVREKPSTSYLQRKMQIGYNRAAEIMEHFEQEGMVSAPDHTGLRRLLVI
jgi:DNA segregation ATPase FtsK/SpoIIIE-like protein